jgi:hypothetical protein
VKIISEITRKRMSDAHKGIRRPHTEGTKKKLSEINIGKKQSQETIAKRIQKLKGRPCSLETRKKISESHVGHKLSSMHRQSISIAMKKRIGSKSPNWQGGKSFERYTIG